MSAAMSCKWAFVPPLVAPEADGGDFLCGVGSCTQRFSSIGSLEAHYQGRHRHSCATCGRVLPTERLLGIHVAEKHDAYFRAMVRKGNRPVFECLVDGCGEVFLTDSVRRKHLVKRHCYPKAFNFHRSPRRASAGRLLRTPSAQLGAASAAGALASADVCPITSAGRIDTNSGASKSCRRPKKKRDPAVTPCVYDKSPRGCRRGDKCPYVHQSILVAIGSSRAPTGPENQITTAKRMDASDSDDESSGGGCADGDRGSFALPLGSDNLSTETAACMDADDGNVEALSEAVARIKIPSDLSFGRRGRGRPAGFSKS